jgi:hypothetical protein
LDGEVDPDASDGGHDNKCAPSCCMG